MRKDKTKMIFMLLLAAGILILVGCIERNKPPADTEPKTPSGSETTTNTTASTATASESVSESGTRPADTASTATIQSMQPSGTAQISSTTRTPSTTRLLNPTKPTEYDPAAYAQAYAYAGFKPALAVMDESQWNLLLVNGNYVLPENYKVQTAPSIKSQRDSLPLDYRVAEYYNAMYLAAKAEGITLTPVSGYRSFARQKTNFENKIKLYQDQGYSKAQATRLAAEIVMIPGASEHNAGMAMDICSLNTNFDQTKEFRWLKENAADYGFILRYTKEKYAVTKVSYEPWHWRYVGLEHAKKMKQSGQCLEEYLGYN